MRTTPTLPALAALAASGCYVPYYASLFNQPTATAGPGSMTAAPAAQAPQAPAAPQAPRTPPRWQGSTAVRLVNRSAVEVCYVHMAPEREQDLGGDWLGASETVAVGATREFGVQPAKYRVRLESCDRDVVLDQAGLDFMTPRELVVVDAASPAPAASADRIVVRTSVQPRPAAPPPGAYATRDTGYRASSPSYAPPSFASDRDDDAPSPRGGGASTYSLTLHNGCPRDVRLFVGRGNPPFGSGTNTSLGANNTRSFSGFAGAESIWIVDASGRGVSSLQPSPGSSRVEITSGCSGFARY